MNNNSRHFKISEWLWVLYPVLTAVFIMISLNYLMGTGPESVMNVIQNQSQNDQEEKNVAQLKTRLEILKNVDKESETGKLKALMKAVPAAKKIWYLIKAIDNSASDSGMVIIDYSGQIGDVKEATDSATASAQPSNPGTDDTMGLKINYQATDFANMYNTIREMENYLPLVKIDKVTYGGDKITLDVEGAWGKYIKPVKDISVSLTGYQQKADKALNEIAGMQDLTDTATDAASEEN